MIIFVETGYAGQDITDESVCFCSSVGNLVNFLKREERQAFHHLCIAVQWHSATSRIHGCGVLFSFAHRFTRASNRMNTGCSTLSIVVRADRDFID